MAKRPQAALLAIAALLAAGIIVLVLAASSGAAPPATGAAQLVPGDALVYMHLSTDDGRPAVQEALRVARRLPGYPLLSDLISTRIEGILSGSSSPAPADEFGAQIRPWLGREVAFALLNSPTSTAGSMIVLDVRSRGKATAFLRAQAATPSGTYRGTQLLSTRSLTTLAFVRHYLVIGQPASVRTAIDVASGRAQSLAANASYRAAAAGEPASRFFDAYASAAGVRRVLAARGGLLGALGVLLYQPALTGTTISASAQPAGLRLRVHAALDPVLARLDGSAAHQFAPTLAGVLPAGTTLLLDTGDLERIAPQLFQAGAEGGVAGRIGPLLARLGKALSAEGVDLPRLESLFSGESAVAVSPSPSTATTHAPALVIVTRTRNEQATRNLLASVEAPLAALFPPPGSGPGVVPEFNNVQVAGVSAHQLAIAPGLALDYAVFRGLVVISTTLQALGEVAHHSAALVDEGEYAQALAGRPGKVTSLVFADFSQLLRIAEQTGLTSSATIRALQPDLEKIRAIGLASTGGQADMTAELEIQIP